MDELMMVENSIYLYLTHQSYFKDLMYVNVMASVFALIPNVFLSYVL
jgi:hypothetical protein